jgi:hypothetical protein
LRHHHQRDAVHHRQRRPCVPPRPARTCLSCCDVGHFLPLGLQQLLRQWDHGDLLWDDTNDACKIIGGSAIATHSSLTSATIQSCSSYSSPSKWRTRLFQRRFGVWWFYPATERCILLGGVSGLPVIILLASPAAAGQRVWRLGVLTPGGWAESSVPQVTHSATAS